MTQKKLLVFAGKPGVGKTTIIQTLFPHDTIVDVSPFVHAFRVEGKIPEEKTLLGYKHMYEHLSHITSDRIILEIGTNHPTFNIAELEKLHDAYDIQIFLCDASEEHCRTRALHRATWQEDLAALEKRLSRDFPHSFIQLLQSSNLSFQVVNMDGPLDDTVELIRQMIESMRR